MYYKIEPTGCCERKGTVQVRYCFYLEEGDKDYDKHYIDVPDIKEYTGKEEDFEEWVKKQPTKKQLNPFHNHFVYFQNDVTDKEIRDKGAELLVEAYSHWSEGRRPRMFNTPIQGSDDKAVKALCEDKVLNIKEWQ